VPKHHASKPAIRLMWVVSFTFRSLSTQRMTPCSWQKLEMKLRRSKPLSEPSGPRFESRLPDWGFRAFASNLSELSAGIVPQPIQIIRS
jgi:hypothetical protein